MWCMRCHLSAIVHTVRHHSAMPHTSVITVASMKHAMPGSPVGLGPQHDGAFLQDRLYRFNHITLDYTNKARLFGQIEHIYAR